MDRGMHGNGQPCLPLPCSTLILRAERAFVEQSPALLETDDMQTGVCCLCVG